MKGLNTSVSQGNISDTENGEFVIERSLLLRSSDDLSKGVLITAFRMLTVMGDTTKQFCEKDDSQIRSVIHSHKVPLFLQQSDL